MANSDNQGDLLVDYENLSFNIYNEKVVLQIIFYDSIFIAYHCSKTKIDMIEMLFDEFKMLKRKLKADAKLFPHVDKTLNSLRDIAVRIAWVDLSRMFRDITNQQLSTGKIVYNTITVWLDRSLTSSDAINLREAVVYLLKKKGIYPDDFEDRYEEVIAKFLI